VTITMIAIGIGLTIGTGIALVAGCVAG